MMQDLSAAVLPIGQASDSARGEARLPVGPGHPAARHHQSERHVWGAQGQVCCQGPAEDPHTLDCKPPPDHAGCQ